MWDIAIRVTPPVSARISSGIDALLSMMHWYGMHMTKHGEIFRQTGGAPN